MTLVYDMRSEARGLPGTHALIIGVDHYPYLQGGRRWLSGGDSYGLSQLTTPVASARSLHHWLERNSSHLHPPLLTLRLVIAEQATDPSAELQHVLDALDQWRADARSHPDNMTFFYFAGHGIQRGDSDAVLLLENFNQPGGSRLRNAIDTLSLSDGMSPSQPGNATIARTQLYFVDACRIEPAAFMRLRGDEPAPAFTREVGAPLISDRCAPFFYGALPGAVAAAQPGGTSFFSRALVSALGEAVADPVEEGGSVRWPVTVWAINEYLAWYMERVRRTEGGQHDYLPTGAFRDSVICYLDQAPEVNVLFATEPGEAAAHGELAITDSNDASRGGCRPIAPHPYAMRMPVGIYRIVVDFTPPHVKFARRSLTRAFKRDVVVTLKVAP